MDFSYTYKDYKNFPEATEISRSREQSKKPLIFFSVWAILASLIFPFMGVVKLVWGLLISVIVGGLAIATLVYIFTKYDEDTEKKIQKALLDKLQMMEEVKDSKYKCKALKVLGEASVGKCMICYKKDVARAKYKIKNDIGTRELAICNECITKFQQNCVSK